MKTGPLGKYLRRSVSQSEKGGTNMYKNQNTDVDDLIFGQTETIVSDR